MHRQAAGRSFSGAGSVRYRLIIPTPQPWLKGRTHLAQDRLGVRVARTIGKQALASRRKPRHVLLFVEQKLVIGHHPIQIVRHHHLHGVQKRPLRTKMPPGARPTSVAHRASSGTFVGTLRCNPAAKIAIGRRTSVLLENQDSYLAVVGGGLIHAREHEHRVLVLHSAHVDARGRVEGGEEQHAIVRHSAHFGVRGLQVAAALLGCRDGAAVKFQLDVEAHVRGRESQYLRQRRGRATERVLRAAARPALRESPFVPSAPAVRPSLPPHAALIFAG
jgi:hypothetical protein